MPPVGPTCGQWTYFYVNTFSPLRELGGKASHIRVHERENDMDRPADNTIRPNLIIASKSFAREGGDALADTVSCDKYLL